jgi:putative endonuclease
MGKQFFVYIMASRRNGTLYVGVTSNLVKRVWQHKEDVSEEFTHEYGAKMFVYFEPHDTAAGAIAREKRIKKWRRIWKLRLIEEKNPEWRDLYDTLIG